MQETNDRVQVAETTLLAIGAVLEWKTVATRFVWLQAQLDTDKGHQNYDLQHEPAYSPQVKVEVCYRLPNGDCDRKRTKPNEDDWTPQYWYSTISEAKAACEIHAATGAFPDAVEPQLLGPDFRPHFTRGRCQTSE